MYKIVYILFASFKGLWLWVKRLRNRCCRKGEAEKPEQASINKIDQEDQIEDSENKRGGARRNLTRYMTVSVNSPDVHTRARSSLVKQ